MILNQCGMDLYKVWSHNNQKGGEGLPTKPCFSYIFNPLYTIIHRHNNQEGGREGGREGLPTKSCAYVIIKL